jgi:hypothetical protein
LLVGAAMVVASAGALAAVAATNAGNRAALAGTTTGSMKMTSTGATSGTMPKAMPIVPLGNAVWQHMDIVARASAPLSFAVFTGTSERMVKVTKKDSMHLMVMLTDARSHAPIPYASVWATIRHDGKVVFDERQWPMLSLYMGTHYGNNVALPGRGTYTLTLLIGPPQAARHPEYQHVWLEPHRVTMTFHWPAT